MSRVDDVVIVGGRCAGATTAMLLARAGLSVRVVEREPELGDVISGHVIKDPGVRRLAAWGLLDDVIGTGAPPIGKVRFVVPNLPPVAADLPPGVFSIAPRRTRLDPLLLDAARDAGATVEMGTSANGLLTDSGRVTGVETSNGPRPARLVIGADGRNSRIARLVDAETYADQPSVSIGYYTYWRGTGAESLQLHMRRGLAVGVLPTNDELSLIFIQAPPGDFAQLRGDPMAGYVAMLRSFPEVASLLDGATAAEHLRGLRTLPNFFRRSTGPGWALVGDAGHHKDPLIARGISDAFRDADLVTAATTRGWDGDLDASLAGYPPARDATAVPLAEANVAMARLDADGPDLLARWLELVALETGLGEGALTAAT
jgi:flavin-dependent dehydrogenase